MKVRVHKPRVSYREKLASGHAISVSAEISMLQLLLPHSIFGVELKAEEFVPTVIRQRLKLAHKLKHGVLPDALLQKVSCWSHLDGSRRPEVGEIRLSVDGN